MELYRGGCSSPSNLISVSGSGRREPSDLRNFLRRRINQKSRHKTVRVGITTATAITVEEVPPFTDDEGEGAGPGGFVLTGSVERLATLDGVVPVPIPWDELKRASTRQIAVEDCRLVNLKVCPPSWLDRLPVILNTNTFCSRSKF
jgi:hypothetical protein